MVLVNVVIVFYICLVLKEFIDKYKLDVLFVVEVKDSVKKLILGVLSIDLVFKK